MGDTLCCHQTFFFSNFFCIFSFFVLLTLKLDYSIFFFLKDFCAFVTQKWRGTNCSRLFIKWARIRTVRSFLFLSSNFFKWRNVSLAYRLFWHFLFVDRNKYNHKACYSNIANQGFPYFGLIYNLFIEIFSFPYSTSHLLTFRNFRPKKFFWCVVEVTRGVIEPQTAKTFLLA